MTVELTFFIAILAFVSSVCSAWALGYALHIQKSRIVELYYHLNYLRIAAAHHELIPLPWEELPDDLEDETNTMKREGNVVYLQSEE